jgi:hypothetical protein
MKPPGGLDFLVCGLPSHERRERLFAMFGAFVDDTGNDQHTPFILLAALVAEKGAWNAFSAEWQAALDADKRIEYFKSSEANRLDRCFAGFTRGEAEAKTAMLTDIILRHINYGIAAGVMWNDFARILEPHRPKPGGTKRYFLKHPYFITFHEIVGCIGQAQVNLREKGAVDFMFDQQGKWYSRCKRLHDELKPEMPKPYRTIFGEVSEGDDKVHRPLQAADLVAGQTRHRTLCPDEAPTSSWTKIFNSGKLHHHQIIGEALRDFIRRDFNLIV